MDDDPASGVRRKKDSSLVRAAEAVRDGRASAMVSAGNTGATMASALLRMGRLTGVARPAIATPDPGARLARRRCCSTPAPTPSARPAWLVQFAQMGSAFARRRFGIDAPRVGLLSIGEEDTQGHAARQGDPRPARGRGASAINFIGNVEGRDLMTDDVDVVVTDGFTGNVALKTLEGGLQVPRQRGARGLRRPAPEAKAAGDVLLPAARCRWPTDLDPDTHGGAMLLGVDGRVHHQPRLLVGPGDRQRRAGGRRHGRRRPGRATRRRRRERPTSAAQTATTRRSPVH